MSKGNFPALIMACYITESADIGSNGISRLGNNILAGIASSIRTLTSSEMPKQGKQVPVFHGITDFAEVYSFTGSSFNLAPKAITKARRNECHIFLKQ